MAERRPLVLDSGVLTELPTGDSLPAPLTVRSLLTTSHTVVDADLVGDVLQPIGDPGNLTITVNSGLVGTKQITFVREDIGLVTFVAGAGVTLKSVDGNLVIREQYSFATLIPAGSDTFYVVGDLSA